MPAKNLTRINDVATYSHIYNSGVEKRVIFESVADYEVFLGFLKDYLTPQDPNSIKKDFKVHGRTFQGTPHLPKNYFNEVELIAYSLTTDRFDLILRQKTLGSIERFLRSLCTRYSMYFNKKYHRSGSLFEGPYKSVLIKDELQLSRLTAFLHHLSNNSSYPEYLGTRETSWVKPQKELRKTDHLERSPKTPLERRNPLSSEEIRTDQVLKVRSRMPEFMITSTVIFLLLTALGVRNIQVSAAKSNQPLPNPAVLAEIKEATASAKPEATPETSLIVRIADDSPFVNIRQKPTVNSEKIGQANDGDSFEFISLDSGWYEIRLADGQRGFISAKYAEEE